MFSKGLLTKVLGKNLFKQCGLHNTLKYGFAFPTQPSDYANLKKLSQLMNAKQLDINEEIDYDGQVRLINSNNKQLGVMPFEEAFNKAKDMNLDIVLVNSQSNPVICKTVNYKEEIYSKFAKEIISQEAESRKVDSKKPKKQIQISINISNADIRTKAQICRDISKKNPQIKVFIQTNDAQEEQAKNILYTFKDLVKEDLVSEHDLMVRSLLKDELDSEDLFNDKKATKQVELHLQTIEFNQTQSTYSTELIKKLVDQYLRELNNPKKDDAVIEELKTSSKTLKQLERFESNSKLLVSEQSLEEQINEFAKDIKDEEEDENMDKYLSALEEISKRQKRSIHDIQDEIDNLRFRLQTSKEQALVLSLLEREEKRLRDYKRTLKLAKAVRN
ncbi:translation initiation factor IF-3 (macronuclear) [Tetrahymena thermophila SB210]|uniref:Translation initiation factor IF-3 n=1 Tax=Tetrahymena thermophila (strain SB210) TaxID=312017 RepID=I7MG17_TETTS|nr:translation initiation factor IF-3 [Tetrahymena thermophila SB210]EAR84673.2 translation initiation factor IF-3 [Tetrahymena thermophila SB210]|eukprot:XP_001032336.2 translation initiation factor IF-3 [Tetrahymena thermophila SB210]